MKNISSNAEIQSYIKGQTSGACRDNKWQRVTTSDRASTVRDRISILSKSQTVDFMKSSTKFRYLRFSNFVPVLTKFLV